MGVLQTVEINTALLVSIVAVILSAYSIVKSNKRSDSTEIKEATTLLTRALVEIETIKEAVLGKPTMAEIIAQHEVKLIAHDERISHLEQKTG